MPTCADYGDWVNSIIAGRFELIADNELSVQVVSGPLTTVGTGTASLVWKRAK